MSPKPPDILRKSHRHTERDVRATAKLELRQELADAAAERDASSRYDGSCACGAIGYVFATRIDPSDWQIRRCACEFCTRNDMLYTSDPAGSIELRITDAAEVERRRFGLETAEFLVCRRCGDVVAAITIGTDDPRAIVNLRLLDDPPAWADAELVDYSGETREEREQRHDRSWTPLRQPRQQPTGD